MYVGRGEKRGGGNERALCRSARRGKLTHIPSIQTKQNSQAYILNNDELQFLRGRVEETQASGYLESYRARVREVTKASNKKSLKALVGGALGGGEGEEGDDEDEDEDEAVESAAAAAAAAATEEGGGGGAGAVAGAGGAAAAPAGKAKSMVLDENYGGEDY